MKKLIIVSLSLLSISCSSNSTPECADEVVKRTAIEILNENIKEVLTKEYVSKNYNYEDTYAYALDNGLDLEKYPDEERKKIEKKAENYATTILSKSKVINIRTDKLEDDIKKCSCSADIENSELSKIEIDYTAQYTEDQNNKVYVELSYNIK